MSGKIVGEITVNNDHPSSSSCCGTERRGEHIHEEGGGRHQGVQLLLYEETVLCLETLMMFDHVYMLINLTYPTLSSEYAVI